MAENDAEIFARRCLPDRNSLRQIAAAAAGLLIVASAAIADETKVASHADVRSLDRVQAEQERLKKMLLGVPKAYVDKVMLPGALPSMEDDGTVPAQDLANGYSAYFSETRIDAAKGGSDGASSKMGSELGQRIGYRRESLNYGDVELTADLRTGHGLGLVNTLATQKTTERVTLRNLAFPVTPRTFADTSVGDIFTDTTDALARNYRLSLGSRPVRGASTRLYSDGWDLRAGFGELGNLVGGPYPGFERTGGSLAWGGASMSLSPQALVGLQASHASEVAPRFASGAALGQETIDAAAAGITWGGDLSQQLRFRGRLVGLTSQSQRSLSSESAQGLFAEASVMTPAARYEFGGYQADPGLRYGDARLISDNRGFYGRMDTGTLRTTWGLGLQLEEQNPDGGPGRPSIRYANLNVNAQHQVNRRQQVGGALSVENRRSAQVLTGPFADAADSRSFYATAYYQHLLPRGGPMRLRFTARRNAMLVANAPPATGQELEWEYDWAANRFSGAGTSRLVTTLGAARERSDGDTLTSPTAAVMFNTDFDAGLSLAGHLRYTARHSNLSTSQGLSGSLEMRQALAGGWQVGASLNVNQAVVEVSTLPGVTSGPSVLRSNDKYASIWLRWEGSSGSTARGLGVTHAGSAGAGSIGGWVFFDEDRDGQQQASERGVSGVEVLLDGRFRATTDRNGRFDFPMVPTGPHRLTLVLESVPLPWGSGQDRGWNVDVPLRDRATARIPVVRVGE